MLWGWNLYKKILKLAIFLGQDLVFFLFSWSISSFFSLSKACFLKIFPQDAWVIVACSLYASCKCKLLMEINALDMFSCNFDGKRKQLLRVLSPHLSNDEKRAQLRGLSS